jgi:FAD/FMN-containing dehydrogenase
MVDHRPALIAHCLSAQDVRSAVRFAHDHWMLLSVRGGGHHIAGNAVADGGLTIDLSRMRSVRVDAVRRTARIGGGALLGDVDHETQGFGLATPLGINSTTGLGGLCLGGGFGWLTRKYGLTIDNLVSADVVTADGDLRVASAVSEPDLYWAIRGGGGNFGVVTSFELELHRVGPLVHAGLVVYPAAEVRDVLRAWRDFTETASDDLTVWAVLRKAPPLPLLPPEVHGTDVVVIVALYVGDLEEGVRATAPLLGFGHPLGHALGPQPYEAFQTTFDPLLAAGFRNYWKSNEFAELDDDALDMLAKGAVTMPSPHSEILLVSLGGAMGRVPRDATAYAGRDAQFLMNVHARWDTPAEDAAIRTWARGIWEATAPLGTGGGYVNFMTADETARVASAYGANYERLQELKQRFDPDNLFRMNHTIAPRDEGQARARPATRLGRPRPGGV